MGSASVNPTNLGKAYVPPQPGSRPSLTSGNPNFVFGEVDATLASHFIAHSRPPPKHAPWIAATKGTPEPFNSSNMAWPLRQTARRESSSPAFFFAASMPMSAPAIKLSGLLLMKTAALTSCFDVNSFHSILASSCNAGLSVFIFWLLLSRRMIATPSFVTSGTPAKNLRSFEERWRARGALSLIHI